MIRPAHKFTYSTLYGTLKTHKSEKYYPMRALVSNIGSSPFGTSKFLGRIIQPTLNKNNHRVTNTSSLMEEAEELIISPNKIQTSLM